MAILTAGALLACGGGGGDSASPATQFPVARQDTFAEAASVDLKGAGYMPFAVGDRWVYNDLDGLGRFKGSQTIVEIVSGPDADGVFVVRTTAGPQVTTDRYRQDARGLWELDALVGAIPASAQALVDPVMAEPRLFAASGETYVGVRAGPLGQDLDGDGKSEGFRIEYSITFDGYPTLEPSSGARQAAKISTKTTIELATSRTGELANRSWIDQTSIYVPTIGLYRSRSLLSASIPVSDPEQVEQLVEARVGGRLIPSRERQQIWFLRDHFSQVHDRVGKRFIVGQGADRSGSGRPARLLGIAPDFSMVNLLDLASDPIAMCVAMDGQSLFVALASGQLLQLTLPSLAELGRLQLGSVYPGSLECSPTNPQTVYAGLGSRQGGRTGDVVVDGMKLPPDVIGSASTPGDRRPGVLSSDGSVVYTLSDEVFLAEPRIVVRRIGPQGFEFVKQVTLDSAGYNYNLYGPMRFKRIGRWLFVMGQIFDEGTLQRISSAPAEIESCEGVPLNDLMVCTLALQPGRLTDDIGLYSLTTITQIAKIDFKIANSGDEWYGLPIATPGTNGQVLVGGQAVILDFNPDSIRSMSRLVDKVWLQ